MEKGRFSHKFSSAVFEAIKGFEALFHSFHMPYYYYIIYIIYYRIMMEVNRK